MTNPLHKTLLALAMLLVLPGAYLCAQSKIFWSESTPAETKIRKANLDGTNAEDIIVSNFKYPDAVALDAAAGKLYWTESTGAIRRSNLDGSNAELLLTVAAPGALTLDLVNDKMYFADEGYTQISRANLDGSDLEVLYSDNAAWLSGLALDVAAGKIYVCEQLFGELFRINIDGSNKEVLIPIGTYYPFDVRLDVAAGKMYWVDSNFGKIYRSDLSGANIEILFDPSDGGAGYFELDVANGKMYWTDFSYGKLFRSDLDGNNIEEVLSSGLAHNSRLAYDPLANKIYWSNYYDHFIKRVNADGSNQETLHESAIANPTGFSVDLANSKVYWADDSRIRRADFDGANIETLFSNPLQNIRALALDVDNNYMYWLQGLNGSIWKSNLDGSGEVEVVDLPDNHFVVNILLDTEQSKIYWGNRSLTNPGIYRANTDGTNVENVLPGYRATDMAIANDKIYWASIATNRGIRRANLDGSGLEELIPGTAITTPQRLTIDPVNGKMLWVDIVTDLLERADLNGANRETLLSGFMANTFAIHENVDQTFTVDCNPNYAPTVVCLSGLVVEMSPTGAFVWATDFVAYVEDDCTDNPTITYDDGQLGKLFTCADVGTQIVTIQATDAQGAYDFCVTFIEIQDNFGVCFCQEANITLNSSGQVTLTPADVVSPDALTGGGTFSLSETTFDCDDLGANVVTVTQDLSGNISTCDATVVILDGPPLLTCQDISLPLNNLGEATLTPAQIILSATDDCGITGYNLSQSQFTCADLGAQNVMLSVSDDNSHSTSCNAVVTVTGLPCEFDDPGTTGVGTSTGSVAYNPDTGEFSVNSTNNAGSPTTDNVYFIPSELCGDGEFIAEVTSVTSSGFAGIMMRETLAPGAKKFAVYTNFGANVRREIRINTNGPANIGQIFRPNTHWLRIRRIGNTFTAFSSTDGTTWNMLISANIGMASCIQVGLATYSLNSATPVVATFDNVQIIDYVPLIDPSGGNQYLSAPEVGLFPNPTTGEVTLQWGEAVGQSADLDIFDSSGRLVYHRRWDIVDQIRESLDLSALENGLYLVRIAQDDVAPAITKLVMAR